MKTKSASSQMLCKTIFLFQKHERKCLLKPVAHEKWEMHTTRERHWEMSRILMVEQCGFPLKIIGELGMKFVDTKHYQSHSCEYFATFLVLISFFFLLLVLCSRCDFCWHSPYLRICKCVSWEKFILVK